MSSITVSPRTLSEVIPGGLVRNIALVAGGILLVALSAQVKIYLPFTPVPLTLQTFAVLLTAAALGTTRATLSLGIYLLAGMAGVPWFAQYGSGWAFASFGYILGFVAAAALVGKLAEKGADRTPLKAAALMVVGNLVVYAFGVAGLMIITGMSFPDAIVAGVAPFLIFDAIKIAAAAGILPAAWKLVQRRR